MMYMNSMQQKTLQAIFKTPVPRDLEWSAIEALLIGSKLIEGSGSRVKFELNGRIIAFHRPHKPKIAKPYQINMVRDFLEDTGVKP